MSKLKNIIEQQFGNYTVIGRAGNNKYGASLWLCLCVCGEKSINRGADLRSGKAKSCGCGNWEKEKSSYGALHAWIERRLGKATYCYFYSGHKSKRYEWANVSGLYLRDVNDFISLCVSCHRDFDRNGRRIPYASNSL